MSRLTDCNSNLSKTNNYLIGSNICNAFVVGEIGSKDNFFMIAAEPKEDSNYPLITGNFLDSEGSILFKLEQNTLIVNPGHCSKILSDHIGYEIHDSEGNLILKVETKYETLPRTGLECWVTKIEGKCFDKNKNVVLEANGELGYVESSVGCAMGFNGKAFGFVLGMSDTSLFLAQVAVQSQGKVYEPIFGLHKNETIDLDGKILMSDAVLENCLVTLSKGNFQYVKGSEIHCSCKFELRDEAGCVGNLIETFMIHNAAINAAETSSKSLSL